jgi:uroporphyrinogen-III decarboxylase
VRRRYLERYIERMGSHDQVTIGHTSDAEVWVAAWRDSYELLPDRPDWMTITVGRPRSEIDGARLLRRTDGWYRVPPDGESAAPLWENVYSQDVWQDAPIRSRLDVEERVPAQSAENLLADGRLDLASRLISELGQDHFTMTYLSPPFATLYDVVGFADMMTMPLDAPDLTELLLEQLYRRDVERARAFAAAGFDGILLENCLVSADLISPRLFETFVYPWDCRFVQALNELGLRVVHYFCGDVIPRLPLLGEMDVDCLAVEESKKGFEIDIGEVVDAVGDRMCVAGNIDAAQMPWWSKEELDAEIRRQVQKAKGAHGFIISTGSPFPGDAPLHTVTRFMAAGRRYAGDGNGSGETASEKA